MNNLNSGGWRFLNGQVPAGGLLAGIDPYAPVSQDFSGLGNINVPKPQQPQALSTAINATQVNPLTGLSNDSGGGGDVNNQNNSAARGSPFGSAVGFNMADAAKGFAGGMKGGLMGGLLGGVYGGLSYNQAIADANDLVNNEQDYANSPAGLADAAMRDNRAISDMEAASEGYGAVGPSDYGYANEMDRASDASGGGYGGSLGDGGRTGDAGYGNDPGGDAGNYAKGGIVDKLHGPNPKGPDDGYAALKRKEGVLTVETVRRIGGKKAIDALNSGKAKIVMIG
jgi:hypothetical protein